MPTLDTAVSFARNEEMNCSAIVFRTMCSGCRTKILAENVLSQENRQRTIDTLKSLKPITRGKMISKRRAAVLVPLCKANDELSLLFTTRSMRLRSNRGQVAFPGGMEDLDDKSLKATALRETQEEIGLDPSSVDVWGAGPAVGRDDMMVTPFLAYVGNIDTSALKINTEEVENAFTVPLSTLCDPSSFRTTHFRSQRGPYVLPVFITPELRMWGLTALIAHTVLLALLPGQYRNQVQRQVLPSGSLPRVVFAASFLTQLSSLELGA